MTASPNLRGSAFADIGLSATTEALCDEIRTLYKSDDVPWVIGYSGGKDSTAVLQLVWTAVEALAPEDRHKSVHVISTDTLVENPIVVTWVDRSLKAMSEAAGANKMPIEPHRLTPRLEDTFWVNLIGKGYPAPRNMFRWCTERLKIKPSNEFIRGMVNKNGETILVLGTRRQESTARARNMASHDKEAVRDRLTPNASLLNSLIYTPIEAWNNDDVWLYLMQTKNSWGIKHKDLLGMYRGASTDGECPLVVDTTTPSCGSSRFGCWVCTLVDEDKSMAAMIQNDEEQEWMRPLLELRNELDFRTDEARALDRERRDFRRITGKLTHYKNKDGEDALVPGPYTQKARARWLRRVLEVQHWVNTRGPEHMRDLELIRQDELHEIRRIWVAEKHEVEDLLPGIVLTVLGEEFPEQPMQSSALFSRERLDLLKKAAGTEILKYELARNLLSIEYRYRFMGTRRGLFNQLEKQIRKCFYDNEEDALARATALHKAKEPVVMEDSISYDATTKQTQSTRQRSLPGFTAISVLPSASKTSRRNSNAGS